MFCPKCGQQIPEGSFFCPACGTPTPQPVNDGGFNPLNNGPFSMERDPNSVAAKIRKMLSSNLFVAICIALSVTAIPVSGLPIIAILFAIGGWIAYAKARSSDATMQLTGLNLISGTMKAVYVINWIAVVVYILCSVLAFVSVPVWNSTQGEISAILQEEGFIELVEGEAALMSGEEKELFYTIMDMIVNNAAVIFIVIGIICVIMAAVMIVYNLVFYKRFCNFAKNMGAAYITNNPGVLDFKSISGMLIAISIINIIFYVLPLITTNIVACILSAGGPISFILAAKWINQLKISFETPVEPNINSGYQQFTQK